MSSVTVTSVDDPDCIGAVPLPFSSESASAKLRSTAPPLVIVRTVYPASPAVSAEATVAVVNIVGRTKHI